MCEILSGHCWPNGNIAASSLFDVGPEDVGVSLSGRPKCATADEFGCLTVVCTSNPTYSHSRNSVSKFNVKINVAF